MTLFELVYACRLFGKDDAYDALRQGLEQNPDLASEKHQDHLLHFLNAWGCRIPEKQFPTLKSHLKQWWHKWATQLPPFGGTIFEITDIQHESIAKPFNALLTSHFQETCVAKTLHAIRPRSLPMWDRRIKEWFLKIPASTDDNSQSSTGQIYTAFIRYVAQEELSTLENDAKRSEISLTGIPELVKKPDYSLVKLLDEYHWITITSGYTVPTRDELEKWLSWI